MARGTSSHCRRPRQGLVAGLLLLVCASAGSRAQDEQRFGEEERVTAIDLIVDLWESGSTATKLPKDVQPEDFRLIVGGEARSVVAIGPPSRDSLSESWQVVVYVDEALSSESTLRWASDLLSRQSEGLTRLGEVDLVVAAEEPEFLVRGTRDPGLLENALSRLSESGRGLDELTALRSTFLTALNAEDPEYDPQELRLAFRAEEERLTRGRLDMLLTFLVDDAEPGSRRTLLLVSDGFDLDPDDFYRMWSTLESGGAERSAHPQDDAARRLSGVADIAAETARAMSAYGWITHPMVAPERPGPLVPGLRVGKWRVSGPAGGRIIGLRIVREHQRQRQKAEDLLELGLTELEKGQLAKAEESFRQALVRFAGDPRTAQSQAQAYLGLSEALALQGEDQPAREALARAALLDPAIEAEHPEAVAALWEPVEPLEILARESSGGLVESAEDLTQMASELGRRIRLTYQEIGSPRGEMLPVEVECLMTESAPRAPVFTRFGTPATVSAARARRLLAGDLTGTELELDLLVQSLEGEKGWQALARFEEAPNLVEWREKRILRVTLSTAAPDVTPSVTHHLLQGTAEEPWPLFSGEIPADDPPRWVAVVMEDLATGHWGADVVELE